MKQLSMTINGVQRTVEVDDRTLLATALRDHFNLTGTHIGCDTAQCGACSVRLNGRVIKSCSIFAMQSEGGTLETIEGVAPDDRTLHPMQVAFSQTLGLQCGYCTPGMLMLALDLIQENPDPTVYVNQLPSMAVDTKKPAMRLNMRVSILLSTVVD